MNTLGLLRPWRRLSLGRAVSPKAPGLWGTGPGPLRMTQHEAGPENCEPLSGALWTCRCLHPGRDDSVLKLPRALGVAILCVHRGGDRGSEEIWPHCGGDQVQAQPLIPVHRSVLPARVLEVGGWGGAGWGRGKEEAARGQKTLLPAHSGPRPAPAPDTAPFPEPLPRSLQGAPADPPQSTCVCTPRLGCTGSLPQDLHPSHSLRCGLLPSLPGPGPTGEAERPRTGDAAAAGGAQTSRQGVWRNLFLWESFLPFHVDILQSSRNKNIDGLLSSSARGDDYPHHHTTLRLSAFEMIFSGVNS